jgi:hypothetical protein
MVCPTGDDNAANTCVATAKAGENASFVRLTNRASPLNSARFAKQHFLEDFDGGSAAKAGP